MLQKYVPLQLVGALIQVSDGSKFPDSFVKMLHTCLRLEIFTVHNLKL